MKLGISFFVLLMCTIGAVHSKAVESFGVVGGVNVSSWRTDLDSQDPVSRSDLSIGGFASFRLSSRATLLLEGLYSKKHGDLDVTVESAYANSPQMIQYLTDFEYLEFPVLLQLGKKATNNLEVFFLAGPVLSFELDANFEIILPEGTHAEFETSGFFEGTQSPDLGALFGLGLKSWVKGRPICLSARYNHGVTEVVERFGEPKNRAIILLISVGI